ncbi:hypothetical protein BVRB_5g113680 isoform B [Beta vulgaris subsp. vulgaris]|uniref:Uncharacterized protein n=1 Tax=Beta vulgaris subsp. vulgaris TaxID=3555 RepID=A0A0J8F4V0_BETVV|nr:uncharacterized protein LOC104893944 isoform X2 [Beta vulgaris subsp. vulgaris]KMT10871.1 hypothetical protein BVRB_5g113680 isoform B [Beta vulgaris subsp. vulgaris]
MDTGDSTVPESKSHLPDTLQCFTPEEMLKYEKYEASYASYLRAKYFSDKDIYGGEIYDLAVTVGNETVKASRWSPTRSYADPAKSFVDSDNDLACAEEMPSASEPETSPNIPNGSVTPLKKNTS